MVQSDQVFYIWNGEFCKKITLLHSKVDVKAPKSIHLMGKTQLKSTKGVLVSNKILELWVKLPVSDHGSIWLGFLNWNYCFISKSISLKISFSQFKGWKYLSAARFWNLVQKCQHYNNIWGLLFSPGAVQLLLLFSQNWDWLKIDLF